MSNQFRARVCEKLTSRVAGQASVEFILASLLFLTMVFGTIDFGRAIYLNHQLESGVRDSLRAGKRMAVSSSNGFGYSETVLKRHVTESVDFEDGEKWTARPGLSSASVTLTCSQSGCPSGSQLTVKATLPFKAVTQSLLGIAPFTLTAEGSIEVE